MPPAIGLIVCALLATVTPSLRAATIEATTPVSMQQALILRVDGELSIDPQGVPTDYQIKTELPQKLRDSLQQHVRSWRFEPVLVGGKPVLAQTQMRVTLAAETIGDTYRVSVDNVTFPQTQGQTGDEPEAFKNPTTISEAHELGVSYPPAALEYGLEAEVLVDVKLTPEGRVDQAVVEQTALLNVKGKLRDLNNAVEMFERQVLGSVKSWRFNVAVHVPDPTAESLTVRVPVHFSVMGTPGARDARTGWQNEVRTLKRTAPWLLSDPKAQSIGVADLVDGELAPAGVRFHLAAPVVGSVL